MTTNRKCHKRPSSGGAVNLCIPEPVASISDEALLEWNVPRHLVYNTRSDGLCAQSTPAIYILEQPTYQHRPQYSSDKTKRGPVKGRKGDYSHIKIKVEGNVESSDLLVSLVDVQGQIHPLYEPFVAGKQQGDWPKSVQCNGVIMLQDRVKAKTEQSIDYIGIRKVTGKEARSSGEKVSQKHLVKIKFIIPGMASQMTEPIDLDFPNFNKTPRRPEINHILNTISPTTGGIWVSVIGGNFSDLSEVIFQCDGWRADAEIYQEFRNDQLLLVKAPAYKSTQIEADITVSVNVRTGHLDSEPFEFTYSKNSVLQELTPPPTNSLTTTTTTTRKRRKVSATKCSPKYSGQVGTSAISNAPAVSQAIPCTVHPVCPIEKQEIPHKPLSDDFVVFKSILNPTDPVTKDGIPVNDLMQYLPKCETTALKLCDTLSSLSSDSSHILADQGYESTSLFTQNVQVSNDCHSNSSFSVCSKFDLPASSSTQGSLGDLENSHVSDMSQMSTGFDSDTTCLELFGSAVKNSDETESTTPFDASFLVGTSQTDFPQASCIDIAMLLKG